MKYELRIDSQNPELLEKPIAFIERALAWAIANAAETADLKPHPIKDSKGRTVGLLRFDPEQYLEEDRQRGPEPVKPKKPIAQDQVNEAIRLHGLYLDNSPEGVRADFSDCILSGLSFRGASLNEIDFICSDLQGADFSGASLKRCELSGGDLRGANFTNTDLETAYFLDSQIEGAIFTGARLTYVDWGHFEGSSGMPVDMPELEDGNTTLGGNA